MENAHTKANIPSRDKKDGKDKLDLDTILVEEIGQFGVYQVRTLMLALVIVMFNAWMANEYIFTTARINTRCFIPECENAEPPTEFSPSWISNAIPGIDTTVNLFDNCQRFANLSSAGENNTCSEAQFDRESIVTCEKYVYENMLTVVYDFDLACNEWGRSSIGTFRTLGTLVSLPLTGFISDLWGRRVALTFTAFNTAWVGVTRYWANSYTAFVGLEILESILGSGSFSCAYILVMELVGPKYRVMAGSIVNTFFALGMVTLGLIAWGVQHWRYLTLVLYIPQLVTISYLWIMSESVRWYMSKGLYENSEKVLKDVARVNGKKLSEQSLLLLRQSTEEERNRQMVGKTKEPWLVLLVYRNKPILLRCMVSPVWWVTMTFIYYGLSVNAVNMTGNSYLNYVAVTAIEIPGYWTSFVLISRIGRKPVMVGAFWMCAVCQIGYIFMPDDLFGLSLTIYLIGKFSIAVVLTANYVYTNELYPTKYRHRLFAFSSTVGRIGAITAPLTPALGITVGEFFPFALFAGFALLSGFLVFLTPETLGSKLPDTMEEATDIGRSKTKT